MSTKDFNNLTSQQRADLAAQVKEVRLRAGLTQQQLADEAGVTRQSIGNIEGGDTTPQAKTLLPVLKALGIAPSPAEFTPETSRWLAIVGGIMDSLPIERRAHAGQAAVTAVTNELVTASSNVIVGGFGQTAHISDEVAIPENVEEVWGIAGDIKGDDPIDHSQN
ncbi:helix-turn-helix transcriptional regulator [Leucobacter luti]|uniref:DNA-binding XRE family transcriptional regulator n=1 Tax=Leucobacter luti TaxID=340320 RepID=A0A4Q7U1Q4_9MICO|nr:helix-turn-helix transcriptional regulator [Leucobacter luti]RZT66787.1 DNA-binding XRE family transcriptional regulator [Leucobacter luti]